VKCEKCKREAEYEIPTSLCLWHWLLWFNEELPPIQKYTQVLKDWVYLRLKRKAV